MLTLNLGSLNDRCDLEQTVKSITESFSECQELTQPARSPISPIPGDFQDAQAFQPAQLERGDYCTRPMAARDLLKTAATPDYARKTLSAADTTLADGAKGPDWGAIAHRVRGESYEVLGELPEALQAFELALPLNPKVGVQNACRGTPQEARALMIRLVSLGQRNHGYYAHQMGSVKDGR